MRHPMSVYDFGRALVETGDLDPVYIVLWNGFFGENKRSGEGPLVRKWLLAYWSFYHMGTASWIVDQPDYWEAMWMGARSNQLLRSSERRHFRGKNAVKSVEYLSGRGVPGLFNDFSNHPDGMTLLQCTEVVKNWVGFGDWIAFKVADMLERLGMYRIRFEPSDVFEMYSSPLHGAAEMYRRHGLDEEDDHPEEEIPAWAYRRLSEELADLKAPPGYERALNIQEIETILCKYKSHVDGHYTVGKDIREVRHGLLQYPRSRTAHRLLRALRSSLGD